MRKGFSLIIITFLSLASILCFCSFFGCSNKNGFEVIGNNSEVIGNDSNNLVWTNENIVYAYIKVGYEEDILKNIEGSFRQLPVQKVYVAEKNTNEWTPLVLLFVLDANDAITQKEFIELLEQDERINHANSGRDLPFETVDTRYIEKGKDTISVGKTLQLTLMGNIDYYIQPFDFKGFYIKPATEKQYNIQSFPDIALNSVTEASDGWLYLELEEENYFNIIKACDKVARLSEIARVEKDKRNIVSVIPPIWQVSDETIVSIETNSADYRFVTITGLKSGTVTLDYAGVKCEIIVR